jgi:hypothetical protein
MNLLVIEDDPMTGDTAMSCAQVKSLCRQPPEPRPGYLPPPPLRSSFTAPAAGTVQRNGVVSNLA